MLSLKTRFCFRKEVDRCDDFAIFLILGKNAQLENVLLFSRAIMAVLTINQFSVCSGRARMLCTLCRAK